MMVGRTGEAKDSFAHSEPNSPFRLVGEAVLAARTGDRSGATEKMARLQQLYGVTASYQYAEIHAQLGEVDAAFASLDRAWQIKDGGLLSLRVDPWIDPIRNDPRFAALMNKMNFPS